MKSARDLMRLAAQQPIHDHNARGSEPNKSALVNDGVAQAPIAIVVSENYNGVRLPLDGREFYPRQPSRPEVAPEIALVLVIDLNRVVCGCASEPRPVRPRVGVATRVDQHLGAVGP